ncbi:unnamed protein product, partial [Prorocentrum cordatum]
PRPEGPCGLFPSPALPAPGRPLSVAAQRRALLPPPPEGLGPPAVRPGWAQRGTRPRVPCRARGAGWRAGADGAVAHGARGAAGPRIRDVGDADMAPTAATEGVCHRVRLPWLGASQLGVQVLISFALASCTAPAPAGYP